MFANTTLTDGSSLNVLPQLAAAAGLDDVLSDLGSMLTLLAPTDAAFTAALPKLGAPAAAHSGRGMCVAVCMPLVSCSLQAVKRGHSRPACLSLPLLCMASSNWKRTVLACRPQHP